MDYNFESRYGLKDLSSFTGFCKALICFGSLTDNEVSLVLACCPNGALRTLGHATLASLQYLSAADLSSKSSDKPTSQRQLPTDGRTGKRCFRNLARLNLGLPGIDPLPWVASPRMVAAW
jgi:hypothetical protein